jgi:hypothetical protein
MDSPPQLRAALDAFALPAVVTPPDGISVETRVFWLSSTVEVPPGTELRRAEMRRILVIPRADVPSVPRGTVVSVLGGSLVDAEESPCDPNLWRVDAVDHVDVDHVRAIVVPHEQA